MVPVNLCVSLQHHTHLPSLSCHPFSLSHTHKLPVNLCMSRYGTLYTHDMVHYILTIWYTIYSRYGTLYTHDMVHYIRTIWYTIYSRYGTLHYLDRFTAPLHTPMPLHCMYTLPDIELFGWLSFDFGRTGWLDSGGCSYYLRREEREGRRK